MAGFVRVLAKQPALQMTEMDTQHDVLISLMTRLVERNSTGALKAQLGLLLRELLIYTGHHFADEEAYLSAIGYERLDTHKLIHGALLTAFRRHLADFEAGDGRLGNNLLSFLKFWLAAHINGLDRQLAQPATPPVSSIVPRRLP